MRDEDGFPNGGVLQTPEAHLGSANPAMIEELGPALWPSHRFQETASTGEQFRL